ncbi:hypothetical protein CEXT_363131 [Caerostris extrusa]|uniref:Uncharacterized protein n=1 Tax=Caerostris extrusa TaxID=172846 RepID=A0AAV4XQT6_CAEEX|nr:hypothetical protein CEXT_363131 [Caerostris extrusa]
MRPSELHHKKKPVRAMAPLRVFTVHVICAQNALLDGGLGARALMDCFAESAAMDQPSVTLNEQPRPLETMVGGSVCRVSHFRTHFVLQ